MNSRSCEQTLRTELTRVSGITDAAPDADSNEMRVSDELAPNAQGGRQAIIEARARKTIRDSGYRFSE